MSGSSGEAEGLRRQLKDVESRIRNLQQSLEQGADIKFVGDRLRELDTQRSVLQQDLANLGKQSPLRGLSVANVVDMVMAGAGRAFEALHSRSPQLTKDALRELISRIEVVPAERTALVYANRLPGAAVTFDACLSDKLCRRSGVDRIRAGNSLSCNMRFERRNPPTGEIIT